MRMVAVVLGGGIGQRMGAALPKQLLRLGGTTLVEHCVAAFEQAPGVDEILVVMAAGYVEQVRDMLAEGGDSSLTGRIRRQTSTLRFNTHNRVARAGPWVCSPIRT